MNCTDKTGLVVSATSVTDEDELMIVTSSGQSVRIKVSEIRETGRAAQGVKLVTLNDAKESIQEITLVIPDDDDDGNDESTDEDTEAQETEAPAEE